MFRFIKRILFAVILAAALAVVFPLAVQAQAVITSFSMDRTTLQSGQSITLTVHTNTATTNVFAEIGGLRTQGTLAIEAGGIRIWSVTMHPAANATEIRVFANTSDSISGAINLTIPIRVEGGAGPVPSPPPSGTFAPLEIVSINEITALAANQVRLEVVTGTGANEVWVRQGTAQGNRYRRATLISTDANTRTWHITLFSIQPWNQIVQVSANTSFNWPGATNRQYTLRHTAPFIAPANPIIHLHTVNASTRQVHLGGSATVTLTTNHEVNYVWATVNGVRVNATRTNPAAAATAMRAWTMTISPATTGNVVIHANATNTPTGAAVHPIWFEAVQTRVQITHASAVWHPSGTTAANATEVQVAVHTNLYATDAWVTVGGSTFPMNRDLSTVSGATRIWTLRMHPGTLFTTTSPITVSANDMGNFLTGAWVEVSGVIPGVGGVFIPGTPHGSGQNHGAILHHSFEPGHAHRDRLWPIVGTFTTADDVTEIRVRDANHNIVGTSTASFTPGLNNTRIWTIGSMFPTVPTGANNIQLTVQIRRGTVTWVDTPAITVPVL